jgi:hypothetical protein
MALSVHFFKSVTHLFHTFLALANGAKRPVTTGDLYVATGVSAIREKPSEATTQRWCGEQM